MSNNQHQPPKWWHHSSLAWNELIHFLPAKELSVCSHWKKLSNGQSNHNYRFSFSEQRYFIQIVNTHNTNLLPQTNQNSSPSSIPIFDYLVNEPNITPWLVKCYVNTKVVRVFKWIEFETISSYLFSQTTFNQKPLLSSVYHFVTDLHRLKLSSKQVENLPFIEITPYLQHYYRLALLKVPSQSEQIESAFQKALLLSEGFSATNICHNDLNLHNLLWNESKSTLKVIDWEYASLGDPILDIAGLILHCQLNPTQEADFIGYYSSQLSISVSSNKLNNMKKLNQLISYLWHFASH